MSSSGDQVTVGYWYYMSAHLMLAHQVDAITRFRIGDRIAWAGNVTTTSSININQPYLFGGETREGGVVGDIDIVMGDEFELPNAYLYSILPNPDPMPAFRGKTAIVLKDVKIAANNPNLRPWNFEVFRQPCKGWYPATEMPGPAGGVNPAHIIRDCLTNATWGLGYSILDLDDNSFRVAADTLYAEGFGLSLLWTTGESLQDFIGVVTQHIDASLFIHPNTGLFTLRLVRDDYDINTIPALNSSNILSLDSFERLGVSELVNQVTLNWFDGILDLKRSVTVHNVPEQELQGGIVSATIELAGIPDATLANKVATRELRKRSTSLSRLTLRANRIGATLMVGDAFKLDWPDLGISQQVFRVGKLEYGALDTSEVRVTAVEDIFSFGSTLYADPPASLWIDPITLPAPAPRHRMTELPYIDVERRLLESPTLIGDLDPMAGFACYQATKPSFDAFSYDLYTKAGTGTYAKRATGRFCPTAVLQHPATQETTSTWSITQGNLLSNVTLNTYAMIGNELVEVTALSTTSITVKRGILDTVPVKHAAGEVIWFSEMNKAVDANQWASGVTVYGKALTLTGYGLLDISLAPEDSLVINRRWYRPYAPGNFQVNGLRWPIAQLVGDLVFTWAHRDRTTQLSYYVAQTEGSIGPEAGVTYTARVYNRTGILVRTVTGLTGTTWTYDSTMESTDAPGTVFKVTLSAVRGRVENWQPQEIIIFRTGIGWGYNYGNLWGGAPVI